MVTRSKIGQEAYSFYKENNNRPSSARVNPSSLGGEVEAGDSVDYDGIWSVEVVEDESVPEGEVEIR